VSINTLIVDTSHVRGASVVNFVSHLLRFKLYINTFASDAGTMLLLLDGSLPLLYVYQLF